MANFFRRKVLMYGMVTFLKIRRSITYPYLQVQEGDVIEVDSDLNTRDDEGKEGNMIKRGRVVVKEIGPPTRKGGSHLTLLRFKHFALLKRS